MASRAAGEGPRGFSFELRRMTRSGSGCSLSWRRAGLTAAAAAAGESTAEATPAPRSCAKLRRERVFTVSTMFDLTARRCAEDVPPARYRPCAGTVNPIRGAGAAGELLPGLAR